MARTRERKREDQVSWKINEPEFHPLEADTVLMVNWEQMFFVMYIYIYLSKIKFLERKCILLISCGIFGTRLIENQYRFQYER